MMDMEEFRAVPSTSQATAQAGKPNTKKDKQDVLDELIELLKKIVDCCLLVVTCGCYPGLKKGLNGDVFDTELMEGERRAVQNLLQYLESEGIDNPTINDERLRALCILTYSDNEELQRSAALCYAEISDRMKAPVTKVTLEPLVVLLQSKDTQVQKAASLAMSNFALNGPESNKETIVSSGAVKPLVKLLDVNNVEVQCNTCGCITTLATKDANKQILVKAGAIKPLLQLAKCQDLRVQRNATGAILNLTHLQSNRSELVTRGAIPVLVDVLQVRDPDIQYYAAAALSNMAVNPRHRAMMVAVGYYDVMVQLISLLSSPNERVQCQACLALRNLASDSDHQVLIVRLGGLTALQKIIKNSEGESLTAAVACLRNLSIHKSNEVPIIQEDLLPDLCLIVAMTTNSEAQKHAAGTLRNLSAGENIKVIASSGCVDALADILLSPSTGVDVLSEVSVALAVLSDEESTRLRLLEIQDGKVFSRLVSLASLSRESEVQYNCAGTIGQIALEEISPDLLDKNTPGILLYIDKFLSSGQPSFLHIALWTLEHLLSNAQFRAAFEKEGRLVRVLQDITNSSHSEAVKELALNVINKLCSV